MIRKGETHEQYVERISQENREKWICIGRVEEQKNGRTCFEFESDKQFLFRLKNNTGEVYMYSIAPSYYQVGFVNPWIIDTEVSAITFLIMYISADRSFGRLNGGEIGYKCDDFKIRLVGMENWLSVDDDYLHNRITLKELENKYV